ncbi:MAG: F0F1 ATP synthase subunit delta, partial [Microthrixaceae bacterium]|nr:F0F1 ATP synthase subunit delta [Microthrixaceae bacterium]
IAGLEVRVGDTVYDGSLRTSLAKAKQSILNHTIEQIERNPQNFLSSH